MRTLTTQFRLMRLIRLEDELTTRLTAPEADSRLRRATARRLLDAIRDVRAAWAADQAAERTELGALRRHVSRALSALEASAAALEQPGHDALNLSAEFRETAVPLLLFLRGLDDTAEAALLAWLAREPAGRTAA
ncbi:MAG: hypothetical protein M3024_10520 [Candidatus Dormibacteraeota bacterium]|nr:hypothetical protein [Candidatus Dormibacteraeota bacterium]